MHASMHASEATLVVLAAGAGRRFGGDKQRSPVGPSGETLVDYALYDAARAGFGRAVLVASPGGADSWRESAATRYGGCLEVEVVTQELQHPELGLVARARDKPWGTAHAVLAAEGAVTTPFAVVNADDFYGAGAFEAAAAFLDGVRGESPPTWALVGYRLADTLSPSGPVSRALCTLDGEGWLQRLEESSVDESTIGESALDRKHAASSADALVSMNFWCFGRSAFDLLRREVATFAEGADLEVDEVRLPDAVQALLGRGVVRVRVLRHRERWFGLTYAQDLERVRAELRTLHRAGSYPARLAGG